MKKKSRNKGKEKVIDFLFDYLNSMKTEKEELVGFQLVVR